MDNECKVKNVISKSQGMQGKWENINKAAFVRNTFSPDMRRFAGTRQERYADNLRRSIQKEQSQQEGFSYAGKYFACVVGALQAAVEGISHII